LLSTEAGTSRITFRWKISENRRRASPHRGARGAADLGYFGVEFAVALTIGSVSLFADSIDFLEDATVNGLILVALGWNARRRSMVGTVLAAVLFAPAIATLWTAWQKLHIPVPPAPVPLSLAGLGALAINLYCAFRLARFRTHSGSLTRAAFLSARNDALANVAIIAAGVVTAATLSPWPDCRSRHFWAESRRVAAGLFGRAR
jgi:Co/Zn/Cd efflux system component